MERMQWHQAKQRELIEQFGGKEALAKLESLYDRYVAEQDRGSCL